MHYLVIERSYKLRAKLRIINTIQHKYIQYIHTIFFIHYNIQYITVFILQYINCINSYNGDQKLV